MLSRRNFFQALGGVAIVGSLGESKAQTLCLEQGQSGQVLAVVDGKAQWVESRSFFVDLGNVSPEKAEALVKKFKKELQQQKTCF